MSILRETVRIRDEPARAHPAAAPGHPRAVPALLAHLHAQQHRAPPHRARAPPPGHAAPRAGPAAQPHELNCVLYFIKLLSTELPLLFPTRADDLYTNFTLHDWSKSCPTFYLIIVVARVASLLCNSRTIIIPRWCILCNSNLPQKLILRFFKILEFCDNKLLLNLMFTCDHEWLLSARTRIRRPVPCYKHIVPFRAPSSRLRTLIWLWDKVTLYKLFIILGSRWYDIAYILFTELGNLRDVVETDGHRLSVCK